MGSNVDLIFDILDQAALIHYDNLKIDYLDCLTEINKNLNQDIYNSRLSSQVIKKLEFIYKPIFESDFLNEEFRLALELYIVKGLKHANYSFNLMTPDFVNYIFVFIINYLFQNKDISIMDTSLGTANLLAAIKNNYQGNVNLVGIENDQKLVSFASSFMEIQHTPIRIYFQDALNDSMDQVNLVIGDLDSYNIEDNPKIKSALYLEGIRYFPYLVVATRINNILDNGYFIYLLDNEFFFLNERTLFMEYLKERVNLVGLVSLPAEIFKGSHSGKSIVIGKKTSNKSKDINVVEIRDTDQKTLETAINKIKTMIDKIKEE